MQEGQYELYQSMGQLESISGGGAADLSSFLGVHSLPVNSNVYKNVYVNIYKNVSRDTNKIIYV